MIMRMYHGFPVRRDSWDLSRLGEGFDQEGPGFYFTEDPADARKYAVQRDKDMVVIPGTGGYLHTVDLELNPKRLLKLRGNISAAKVSRLIKASPTYEDDLTNWDENPDRAYVAALNACLDTSSPHDAFTQVWAEFYRSNGGEWVKNMFGMCGFDACILDREKRGGVQHVVVYNPDVIKVVSVEEVNRA